MRYLLIALLFVAFIYGCGCSNICSPAYGYVGDACDVWPALFGTDNAGATDNGYFICYDQNAAAWQAPRLIATDLLKAQWTPQRNSIGWRAGTDVLAGGKYNATFIEDTSNDLEIWESPDDGWQDDAGAWAMTDSEATATWIAVDVESRQNYMWALLDEGNNNYYPMYINLGAGAPAWTIGDALAPISGTIQFSIVLDSNLFGLTHWAYVDNGDIKYGMNTSTGYVGGSGTIQTSANYPQIIVDGEQRLWCFYTVGNVLFTKTYFDFPPDSSIDWILDDDAGIYTATVLTSAYHATWLAMDDTIHVILIDYDGGFPNMTFDLIYIRRTPNGWSAAITIDSWVLAVASGDATAQVERLYPQITVDTLGNISVMYIEVIAGPIGDLRQWYLDASLYRVFDVPANWVQSTDIEGTEDDVLWVVAPDSIPIAADM